MCRNFDAGSWLTCSVCTLLTKQSSSAIAAVAGRKSLTHAPLSPRCLNGRNGPTIGNVRLAARHRRQPLRLAHRLRQVLAVHALERRACSRTCRRARSRRACAGRSRAWLVPESGQRPRCRRSSPRPALRERAAAEQVEQRQRAEAPAPPMTDLSRKSRRERSIEQQSGFFMASLTAPYRRRVNS